MQNDVSDRDSTTRAGAGGSALTEGDLEKQDNSKALPQEGGNEILSGNSGFPPVIAIAFSNGESTAHVAASKEELPGVDSPRKGSLSRTSSLHEQCRLVLILLSSCSSYNFVGTHCVLCIFPILILLDLIGF